MFCHNSNHIEKASSKTQCFFGQKFESFQMCRCSNSCYKQRALPHRTSPSDWREKGRDKGREWEVEGDVGPRREKEEGGKLRERETSEGRVRRLSVLFFFHQINLTRHSHPSITSLPLTLSLSLYIWPLLLLTTSPLFFPLLPPCMLESRSLSSTPTGLHSQ